MPNSKPGGLDDAIAMQGVREILDRVQVLHLSASYSRFTAIRQEERDHEDVLKTGGCAGPIYIRYSTEKGCPSGCQGLTAPTVTVTSSCIQIEGFGSVSQTTMHRPALIRRVKRRNQKKAAQPRRKSRKEKAVLMPKRLLVCSRSDTRFEHASGYHSSTSTDRSS